MKRSTSSEKKKGTSPSRTKVQFKEEGSAVNSREVERQQELENRRKKIEKLGLKSDDSSKGKAAFSKDDVGRSDAEEKITLKKSPSAKKVVETKEESIVSFEPRFPFEITTGRLLTHYDETAGIAIPSSSVESHQTMGNTVLPLVESYKTRYERLRSLMTAKLFPRREHLLQLRRQLLNTSTEVEAARKGIERETMKDAEQIIERLRAVESMRQSSITLQILQLEEELQAIERVTKRVELAREDVSSTTTGITLTSAVPGSYPIEPVRAPKAVMMVELIQQFADLSATIEKLAVKPVTVQIDFPVDDFPKETSERLEVISRCDRYIHALNVKDHMLWTALQEKKALEEKLDEEKALTHEYAKEVANWVDVTNSLSSDLQHCKKANEELESRNRELINILRKHNLFYDVTEPYSGISRTGLSGIM